VDQITIIIYIKLQAEFGDGYGTYLAGGLLAAPYLSGIGEVLIAIFWSDYGIPDLIAALGSTSGEEA
jgi:hypothetical protein